MNQVRTASRAHIDPFRSPFWRDELALGADSLHIQQLLAHEGQAPFAAGLENLAP